LVKGSIGFIGEVFEVMTLVDLGLTSAGRFDSADSAISGNDVNQKPGASQPTPLNRISSRDSNLQEEMGKKFMHRGVTQEIQLALPHLTAWLVAVVFISGSGVPLLLLGLLLSGVRALICVMPGLPTIVAQTEWKVSGLGELLLAFLDEAEPLLLLFPS
jgi:hypothetical protein